MRKFSKVSIENAVELTDCDIVCVGDNCKISIGAGTTIGGANIVCMGKSDYIIIGKDCMFSSNIDIFNSDTHQILSENKVINFNKSIEIGNHVWIGKNSSILKGVRIGDNSIIGMNTTVTKAVDNGMIVVGNPARVIKNNITWSRNRVM